MPPCGADGEGDRKDQRGDPGNQVQEDQYDDEGQLAQIARNGEKHSSRRGIHELERSVASRCIDITTLEHSLPHPKPLGIVFSAIAEVIVDRQESENRNRDGKKYYDDLGELQLNFASHLIKFRRRSGRFGVTLLDFTL